MKLQLKNITLLSLNCIDPIQSVKALLYSCKHINFAEIILVSNTKPNKLPKNITFIPTNVKTHDDASGFVYEELPNIIKTEFMLSIHDDGFVINPHLWTDEFLQYDYIGAPWSHTIPYYGQKYRVGNGGFSLRSKKIIDLCRNIKNVGHEDSNISIRYRDALEQHGCRFAPVDVAMQFSLEEPIPECPFDLNLCFGFHGRGTSILRSNEDNQQMLDRIKLLETIEL